MKHIYLIPALLLGAATVASAQTHPAKRTASFVSHFVEGDTTGMKKALLENAPQNPNIPGLPRFAIFGKERKFYIGIGGTAKATLGWDFGDIISNPNDFTTSAIPVGVAKGDRSAFDISAQQSSLFLNLVALPGTKDQVGVFFNANLTNDGYAPDIQAAYVKYRGFTAGYNSTLFEDGSACPSTIDGEGPNAFTSISHALVSYEKSFGTKDAWKFGVALEQPAASFTTSSATATANQRVPDIPAYIQYSWLGGNGWLRVSGIVRNLYYRDLTADKVVDKVGWGVKASGSSPLYGGLTAYWQAVYGKGIASYIQDTNGMGMDLYPSAGNASSLSLTKTWGAYAGLQYNFTPDLFCTAAYSQVRNYGDRYSGGSQSWGGQYKYAQYVVGNLLWNVTPMVQTGVEYLWGRRMDCNGLQGHDSRVQTMIQVSF